MYDLPARANAQEGIYQGVKALNKLWSELIEDSNSKSGHAINIRKYQEYPSKPCVLDVKCADSTGIFLEFLSKVWKKITIKREV